MAEEEKAEKWPTGKDTEYELDDELLPNAGEPVPQQDTGGDEPDTAGQHGEMAIELARSLPPERKRSPEYGGH